MPPSMQMFSSVMKLALSEQRNSTMLAMSSGFPTRPAGKAHAGKAIVLGHYDVPGAHPVDQGEIYAVRPFVKH